LHHEPPPSTGLKFTVRGHSFGFLSPVLYGVGNDKLLARSALSMAAPVPPAGNGKLDLESLVTESSNISLEQEQLSKPPLVSRVEEGVGVGVGVLKRPQKSLFFSENPLQKAQQCPTSVGVEIIPLFCTDLTNERHSLNRQAPEIWFDKHYYMDSTNAQEAKQAALRSERPPPVHRGVTLQSVATFKKCLSPGP
ncbi:16699_t:CDS:2, partial [Acaulospora colombiana]